jgi:NAD+ kinase
MPDAPRLALLASPTDRAQEAESALTASYDWVPLEEADIVVVLGGDGFMLQTLHHMLDTGRVIPAYGLNLGTVGFLMNRHKASRPIAERVAKARAIAVAPLLMEATTQTGDHHSSWAINEVSLLRETRQTARLEVSVNGKVRMPELSCDGVLVATPAGSTAYNLSANGPILPLGSAMLALTPISPFRPRRWRGALLPDTATIGIEVRESDKRPVSAVADHAETRSVTDVQIASARHIELLMMFDSDHGLAERILSEQFRY